MSERFFVADAPACGRIVITGDEARHLARVLRARVGDAITVFDGRGRSWPARITALGRGEVEVETGEPRVAEATRRPPVTLAVALPKGDRQRWLVEKLTELGTATLLPLVTDRGVAEATTAAVDRMRRVVIEACKQCGRDLLMEIAAPATVAAVVAAKPTAAIGLVADPGGDPLAMAPGSAGGAVVALVGPEGGFTADEISAADAAGWRRVALGPHVLRVETAAVALAARLIG